MSTANPEASAPLQAYRAVVPDVVRRRVAHKVPTGLRAALKRLLRRLHALGFLTRRFRALRARRRWPQLRTFERGPGLAAVPGNRIAVVRAAVSPLALREANLERVVTALEQADIDHFVIRGTSDLRSCVAVSAADREPVAALLGRFGAEGPVYAQARRGESAAGQPVLCGSRQAARLAREADVVRVGTVWSHPTKTLVLGLEHGCDLEFWQTGEDRLVAPRPNRITEEVAFGEPLVTLPASRLTSFAAPPTSPSRPVRTLAASADRLPEDVRFPIDAVYTWVDGSDPAWLRRRAAHGDKGYHAESANAARYISRDELRYSLRALAQNAPWIRRVHLVTDQQRPAWLDDSHPRITVVDHSEIFDDPSALPTFNSHAIESRLHHIKGLSEHFLYFNDDMFLGRPVTPQDFFLSNGMSRIFFSPSQVPQWASPAGDRPVDAAGKNNRRLLRERFGTAIVHKLRHAPYALRRSVLQEIEREYATEHRQTTYSRFRSAADLSIPSSLYHYHAYLTGRAVPSQIAFAYLDLAKPEIQRRLGILLARRDRQAFCINDTLSDGLDVDRQTVMLRTFLDAYFPVPSPFERKEGEVR
ncbi:stealth family protein [Streptomyces sp. NPDC003660]